MPRRGTALPAPSSRTRPTLAAALAFCALTAFAIIHVVWALGYRWGLTTFVAYEGQREAELISNPWFKALGLWGVALVSIAGAAVAGTVLRDRDGSTESRRVVALLATVAAAVLCIRGGYGLVFSPLRLLGVVAIPDDADRDWFWRDALLLAPAFVVAGASFALIAWDRWRLVRSDEDNRRG